MTFNSLSYAIFLPLVLLVFSLTAERLRWLVLLVASYAFYASLGAPALLVVLVLVTWLSYSVALRLGRLPEGGERSALFRSGVIGCLMLLALPKYLPVLAPGLTPLLGDMGLLSAIGVSYFTLQAVAYLADVYLEVQEPERHPGYHALSLAFFPKLLQGPIERAGDLLPQLKRGYRFDYQTARSGLVLFLWGLFQKVVIADRLAPLVNTVYDKPAQAEPVACLIATYFYAIQLFCDFSGYTDMALGSALLFNIRLTPNFNTPYLAPSVAEFWRRWHISFSRWILDYIFKPLQLGWRRGGRLGSALTLLITFLASGLWHGARWGFLAWGGLHGVYLAASLLSEPWRKRLRERLGIARSPGYRAFRIVVTFHLVCLAWVFFRAATLSAAFSVLTGIARISPGALSASYLRNSIGGLGMTQADLGIACLALLVLVLVRVSGYREETFAKLFASPWWLRWSCYVTLSLMVLLLAQMAYVPYLYFQF